MDGYAVRAEETRGATETRPVLLPIGQSAFYVDTGDPLPPGTNAVIMVEEVQRMTAGENEWQVVEVLARYRPGNTSARWAKTWWQPNSSCRPITACARRISARRQDRGTQMLSVRRKPRIAIQPTGTELVSPGTTVQPGDIIEYNSLVLSAMIAEWGGLPERLPPLADDYAALRERVVAARRTDLVIINAGSSAGSEDYTARVVAELGDVLVHGIAIRPGHPVILGMLDVADQDGKGRRVPVAGLPGYPVSAAMTCELVVRPLVDRWLGQAPRAPHDHGQA